MDDVKLAPVADDDEDELRKSDGTFVVLCKKMIKRADVMIALFIILLLVVLTIISPYIVKYKYNEISLPNMNKPPSMSHLLGTDHLGRDILSRILYGARYSLSIGILAVCFTAVFAILLGCTAGYFGGFIDNIIMRVLDIIHAIPNILFAVIISSLLGPGFVQTFIAIGVGGIPNHARTVRAQIMAVRGLEFVEAAESINCSKPRIIFLHVFPNAITPFIVGATMAAANGLVSAATLSFIGLGMQPPLPEWGAMLSDALTYVRLYPYMMVAPGMFIIVTVMAFNIIGDAVRDVIDPKLNK